MKTEMALNKCGMSDRLLADFSIELRSHIARLARTKEQTPRGLLDWGRYYLAHHFRLPPSAMHVWMAERFDAMVSERGMKLNVIGPRGGAKSTIGTLAHVLRAAVEGWEPYIWIISDTRHQASAHLDNVRDELSNNARLRRDYPRVCQRCTRLKHGFQLASGVCVEAFGAGQHIRGRRRGANRPTLIVCDDVQNDGHMDSAWQRDRSRRWFQGMLLNAGTPSTNVVNLGTALHREALALELNETPGWTSRVFQAIERWPDNMSLWQEWEAMYCDLEHPESQQIARTFYEGNRAAMDEGAVLLWPEHEELYALMCLRVEGGRTAFEREKQGSPIHPDLCEWPETYFDESIWFEEWPARLEVKCLALDPSKGHDSRRGDYSAFVLLGVDAEGVLHVEADLRRRPTPQIVADGVEICSQFQPDAFAIEANQFQDLLGGEFEAEFRRQGLLGVAPWTLDNRVNKQVRIRRLGPYLSSHRLRFKLGSPGTRLLVDQLKMFPTGDHDDGPDALEMAIRLAGEMLGHQPADDGLGGRLVLG